MAGGDKKTEPSKYTILTEEQDALLDQYLHHLNDYMEELKAKENIQVEIETLHLKRILSK